MIERIFGVLKKRFRLLSIAPEYSVATQARIVPALCVVHNFIRVHDPSDLPDISDDEEPEVSPPDGGLRGGFVSNAARERAIAQRDAIAEAMFAHFQASRAQRG